MDLRRWSAKAKGRVGRPLQQARVLHRARRLPQRARRLPKLLPLSLPGSRHHRSSHTVPFWTFRDCNG